MKIRFEFEEVASGGLTEKGKDQCDKAEQGKSLRSDRFLHVSLSPTFARTHTHSYRSQILISPSNLCPIKDKEQLRRLRRVEKCKEKKVAKLFLRASHGSVGNQHHSG